MSTDSFSESRLFRKLPQTLTEQLYEKGEVRNFEAGSSIVREGYTVDRLFVVLEGRVEVVLPGKGDEISGVKLDELGPGMCFGEYAFIDRQGASASIRAVDNVSVYGIDFDTLQRFLNEHPIVAAIFYRNMIEILVDRLRASNAELELFTF